MNKSHAAGWASDSPTPAQLKELFAQIESGRITRDRVQAFLKRDVSSESFASVSTPFGRAQDIFNSNMISPRHVEKHLGVQYSRKDLEQFSRIPWDEKALEEVKGTHILVPGYPLSILEIREKAPRGTFYSYGDAWYNNQPFATQDKVELRWYLIRKYIVPGSTGKTYQEQKDLLTKNEEVSRAVEMVYLMTLYCLTTGTKLFTNYLARTRDLVSGGGRVGVDFCVGGGLGIGRCWDGGHRDDLGLAVSRKFQS